MPRLCVAQSPKGNDSGTGARKFRHGPRPRDGLDLAAAGRADARCHGRVGRRGDVPRASAARSNEGGGVLAARMGSVSAFDRCQRDCLRLAPVFQCTRGRTYICDAFLCRLPGQASRRSALARVAAAIGPRPRRLAQGVLPGPADFKPRVARGAEHAAVKLKAAPRARRRAAMMHR